MARPTTVKIDMGEVIIKNLPKEKTQEIVALLTGKKDDQSSIEIEDTFEDTSVKEDTCNALDYKGFGVNKNNSGLYEITIVKYNNDSKRYETSILETSDSRRVAMNRFKVLVVEHGIY